MGCGDDRLVVRGAAKAILHGDAPGSAKGRVHGVCRPLHYARRMFAVCALADAAGYALRTAPRRPATSSQSGNANERSCRTAAWNSRRAHQRIMGQEVMVKESWRLFPRGAPLPPRGQSHSRRLGAAGALHQSRSAGAETQERPPRGAQLYGAMRAGASADICSSRSRSWGMIGARSQVWVAARPLQGMESIRVWDRSGAKIAC